MNQIKHLNLCMVKCFMILCLTLAKSVESTTCTTERRPNEGSCSYSCPNSVSEEEFQSVSDSLSNCRNLTYKLFHGTYTSFGPGYFSKIRTVVHFTMVITDVTFDYFPSSPGTFPSPFTNVSFDTSAVLNITRTTVTRGWNWEALNILMPIRGGSGAIGIYDSNVTHLGREFRNVLGRSVETIRIVGSNLASLDDDVFSSFSRLRIVSLNNNLLTRVKRNYFPNPAVQLEHLMLENNNLTYLPIDFFVNMPNLREVNLIGNQFATINEVAFRPVIGRIPVHVNSTMLTCDCRLRWLHYVMGPNAETFLLSNECLKPDDLIGVSLKNVSEEEMGCTD